jgi:hypothetical protein
VVALSFTSPPQHPPSPLDLDQSLEDLPPPLRQVIIARLCDPVYVGDLPIYQTPIWAYSLRKEK